MRSIPRFARLMNERFSFLFLRIKIERPSEYSGVEMLSSLIYKGVCCECLIDYYAGND